MKIWKKLCIFVILSIVLCSIFPTVVLATDASAETSGKLDMDMIPESFADRANIALQGTVTGMVMVFAVLGLLAIIVSLSRLVLNRDQGTNKNKNEENKAASAPAPVDVSTESTFVESTASVEAVQQEADDGELAAVITAAIAAMIEGGEYKNEFVGGFRVVSFKRSSSGAWNRK